MDDSFKRTVIAVVLCFLVLVIWQNFITPTSSTSLQSVDNKTVEDNLANTLPLPTSQPDDITVLPEQSTANPVRSLPLEVVMGRYVVNFNRNTGNIISFAMSAYEDLSKTSDVIPTFENQDRLQDYAILTAGITSGYLYREVVEDSDSKKIIFTARSDFIEVRKTYTLSNTSYNIPVKIEIRNLTNSEIAVPYKAIIGSGLGHGFDSSSYIFTGPMIYNGEALEKQDLSKKLKKDIVLNNPVWGGYVSKYFIFGVLSESFSKGEITASLDGSLYMTLSGETKILPGDIATIDDLSLYVGPKDYDTISALGVGLQKSIDYGIFAFLAIPMNKVLEWAYAIVGNYGIAIIILTFIIKVLTLPLTLKSMVSMRAMSKLQPEMVKIKEQYKDDPKKLQAATMELYRKHKVNPLSGCLPILIQLPIFFALYRTLLVSIGLKGAPFFGWITDLSAKDPYYITPVLMGLSMFLMQKMTPAAVDPVQQKVFLFMPLIFTVFFINFPSGLVVYWLTNNILSIIQQFVINKRTK